MILQQPHLRQGEVRAHCRRMLGQLVELLLLVGLQNGCTSQVFLGSNIGAASCTSWPHSS